MRKRTSERRRPKPPPPPPLLCVTCIADVYIEVGIWSHIKQGCVTTWPTEIQTRMNFNFTFLFFYFYFMTYTGLFLVWWSIVYSRGEEIWWMLCRAFFLMGSIWMKNSERTGRRPVFIKNVKTRCLMSFFFICFFQFSMLGNQGRLSLFFFISCRRLLLW